MSRDGRKAGGWQGVVGRWIRESRRDSTCWMQAARSCAYRDCYWRLATILLLRLPREVALPTGPESFGVWALSLGKACGWSPHLNPLLPTMDSYSRIRTIGEGSYGTAVLCEHKRTGRRVVVKFVSLAGMTSTDRRSALQEASLLASFHHPCIIGHVESFEHEGSLCIVCEFAGEGLPPDLQAVTIIMFL